jgi:NMD protein affecting ribosome stability and mRNA decay
MGVEVTTHTHNGPIIGHTFNAGCLTFWARCDQCGEQYVMGKWTQEAVDRLEEYLEERKVFLPDMEKVEKDAELRWRHGRNR